MQINNFYNQELIYPSFNNQINLIEENSKIDELKKDCEKKSAGFWKCVGQRTDDVSGGDFFDFELSEQYLENLMSGKSEETFAHEIDKKLFPAMQPIPRDSLFQFNNDPNCNTNSNEIISPTLKFLGYNYRVEEHSVTIQEKYFSRNKIIKKYFMTLPDGKALTYWWGELRKKYPQLPHLTIVTAEGIANDRMFIQVYLDGKVILSFDEEFVHDHLVHILATISRIFDAIKPLPNQEIKFSKKFEKNNQDLKKKVRELSLLIDALASKLIEEKRTPIIDGLYALLGSFVDTTTSKKSIAEFKSYLDFFENIPNLSKQHIGWSSYMRKRFDKVWDETSIFSDFWKNLAERIATDKCVAYNDENFKTLSATEKYFDLFIDPGISDRFRQKCIKNREAFARAMGRHS